ncbi:MAG: bacterial Ig-like domain-containing protein [Treponema sp.]|nr:bacterial Ig-like domain-containing protein [Treponema sp.]
MKKHKQALFISLIFLLLFSSCKIKVSPEKKTVIIGIKIASLPEKTVYHVGESVDYTGLKVIALYSDEHEKEITDYVITLEEGTVFENIQEYTIEVQYKKFSQTFSISILPVITGIKIAFLPEKTVYHVGESVNYRGLKVSTLYSDEHEEEIEDYTISLEDGTILENAKTYIIEVLYKDFSTTFEIEVLPNQVSVIQVTLPEHFDIENLLLYEDTNKTFTAKTGFESYTWWLDSEKLLNQTATYTLNTSNLSFGYHSIMIVVKNSAGEQYSATAVINILREGI